ncbi:MAG: ammonium transporter [Nitrospinae bacterium]|nr:ammonium transporter [Nitrospinota bacterium]MBF0634323.1 ammonium transporter [Nitrospinota bacterium]
MDITALKKSSDVLFLMIGAVMVFAMHGGFAFLEVGTVRKKNQINALVKILSDFGFSTIVYFIIGFPLAYGITFFVSAETLVGDNSGFSLVRFFFLLTFAAAVPAIISGGIAERSKFWPQALAGAIFVGTIYPLFEGMVWGRFPVFGQNDSWLAGLAGVPFHDYAGSVVVHAMGGWLALAGILRLGPRTGRWINGRSHPLPVSNIPMLALGSWMLCVGWFGFNVMSAQEITAITGLVAVNSLMAMVGGIVVSLVVSKRDPGFVHNGALAGLVAVCAGSDKFHPIGAFIVGGFAGFIFIKAFMWEQERMKIDDVLGVWPLHGLCGVWGGLACGVFGQKFLGGMGGVSFIAQLVGTLAGLTLAFAAGFGVYFAIDRLWGMRLDREEEAMGSDMAIHHIGAYPEESIR